MESKNAHAVFGDNDYLPLEAFSLILEREATGESGSFTLCFWIYLLKGSNSGTVILQSRADGSAPLPLLAVNADRKLVLHPLRSEDWKADTPPAEDELVISDQACVMEKWTHVGLEIGSPVARLHMTGTGVYERRLSGPEVGEGTARKEAIVLSGGPSQTEGMPSTQGFIYFARLLSQPTVTNHYVKNPPLELALDGPSGASDDYEVEEGGDGVWSVVGGKASCRRNFALDVALLDALGRSVHKEMELVAFLVFADNASPVEKLKEDAEAPLLTTFDGVEFPSSERPIKLVHGRASFKLKISQLSSKCDNRLFRVCFDSPNTPKFPFLRVLSRPIRCVSRNRNHRVPVHAHWKHLPASAFPADCSIPSRAAQENTITAEVLQGIKDNRCGDGMSTPPGQKDLCSFVAGQHLAKRARTRQHREVPLIVPNSHSLVPSCPLDNRQILIPEDSLPGLSSVMHIQKPQAVPASSIANGVAYPGGAFPVISTRAYRQTEPGRDFDLGNKQDMSPEGSNLTAAATSGVDGGTTHSQRWNTLWSDQLVFKYCLESMRGRGEFLKTFVMSTCDQELTDFATRVSQFTGCRHDGYQILIARSLLLSCNDVWSKVSQESFPPLWANVVRRIDQSFISMSGCVNRSLSAKDTNFLKRIAGCGDFVSKEEFARLWNWIYPVALALRSSQLRTTWDNEDPRWIEGMITREEVERLLLRSGDTTAKPGTFLLRFASSRQWPHPDSGALVVSYVGSDRRVYHKLLSLDENSAFDNGERPLPEQLLSQPELTQLCKVPSGHTAE